MSMPYSILVVEDEENIALAVEAMIRKSIPRSAIALAADGEEAWQLLQQYSFHLVVSDWVMPGLTGEQLLKKVRAVPRMRGMPFIMLTARSDRDSVFSAIESGVTEYLCKPFEREQLIEKVVRLLKALPA